MIRAVLWLLVIFLAGAAAFAQSGDCNSPPASPVSLDLPGSPFGVAISADGCWVFASLREGVAVLKRGGGRLELARLVKLKSAAAGIALTHDGKLLAVAAIDHVMLLDVARMISGKGQALLRTFSDGKSSQSVYVNVNADDQILFVSDEMARTITVINLAKVRASGYAPDAVMGKIPVGNLPIALTFSPDGRMLYTTSEIALPEWGWPKRCKPEGKDPATTEIVNPEGAIVVVDVERARTEPAKSVIARVPAGCSPVRLALSPEGGRAYVTVRNSNAVMAFDTAKLVSDAEHARLGVARVGTAPVPLALAAGGRVLVVGNSNRFRGKNTPETLTVLDTAAIANGTSAVLGTLPAGAFPRDLRVSPDGRTLFVANYGSNSVQMLDVAKLPQPRD